MPECQILIKMFDSDLDDIKYFVSAKENTLAWARSCIKTYQKVQDHLGFYLLAIFSVIQFLWIDSLFLAMSLPIKCKTEFLPMFLQSFGKY